MKTRQNQLGPILHDLNETKNLTSRALTIGDIGCGEGESTKSLASIFDQATVIGIDIDSTALSTARNNIKNERIKFIEHDIVTYESSTKFDLMFVSMCLHSGI